MKPHRGVLVLVLGILSLVIGPWRRRAGLKKQEKSDPVEMAR